MDAAHEMTDKIIAKAEKKIKKEYRKANKQVQKKANEYFAQFAKEAETKYSQLLKGIISKEEYQRFMVRKTMMGKTWIDLRDTLAGDYHNANQIAKKIYRDSMIDAYALNHNYAFYQIEHDAMVGVSFQLYDHNTVERILKDNPKLMHDPGKKVAEKLRQNPDLAWNKEQVQSSILQSILQGESIDKAARRLEDVTEKNFHAAVRNARTAITGAQNAGRKKGYQEAEELGIELQKQWEATLDGRTRHEHRLLHGQTVAVDEPFEIDGYQLDYPADPDGEPEMVYNCRCTMKAVIKGYETEVVKYSPKMGKYTFEEWLEMTPGANSWME